MFNKCDRCGVAISIQDRRKNKFDYTLNHWSSTLLYENVDLCPKCQREFIRWLSKGGDVK